MYIECGKDAIQQLWQTFVRLVMVTTVLGFCALGGMVYAYSLMEFFFR